MYKKVCIILLSLILLNTGFRNQSSTEIQDELMKKINQFVSIRLTSDLSILSANQKKMIPIFIEIANIMDEIFWNEAYGDKNKLFTGIDSDEEKKFVSVNYGPWERLNNNMPFIKGIGKKPLGANFYPSDMSKEEFNTFADNTKTSMYTLIRRNETGKLISIPYNKAFGEKVKKAANLLKQAALLAEEPDFKNYLNLRAEALITDNYYTSDIAWMDMKNNLIDFIVGPIENYEDQLFGYKAAHEAFILIKDTAWSNKLERYTSILPRMQLELPVAEEYKKESPGSNSDLGVYDVIYYAGDCNSGAKTIAINLPNDEKVQLEKGSRRLQLKNAMMVKFDNIVIPISQELIDDSQLKFIQFDAFFSNTMFHEIAHGLGLKKTIKGNSTVREALKEYYTTIEEGKADILGLYLITRLKEMGEIETDLMSNYTTFLAGILRSIRFGTSSAHGQANLMRFNYFMTKGAFIRDSKGKYSIDLKKMKEATISLSEIILTIQGDGDYDAAKKFINQFALSSKDLNTDLNRINYANIPVDIIFEQGIEYLDIK